MWPLRPRPARARRRNAGSRESRGGNPTRQARRRRRWPRPRRPPRPRPGGRRRRRRRRRASRPVEHRRCDRPGITGPPEPARDVRNRVELAVEEGRARLNLARAGPVVEQLPPAADLDEHGQRRKRGDDLAARPSHRCPPSGFASIRTKPASTAVKTARIGKSERKAKTRGSSGAARGAPSGSGRL